MDRLITIITFVCSLSISSTMNLTDKLEIMTELIGKPFHVFLDDDQLEVLQREPVGVTAKAHINMHHVDLTENADAYFNDSSVGNACSVLFEERSTDLGILTEMALGNGNSWFVEVRRDANLTALTVDLPLKINTRLYFFTLSGSGVHEVEPHEAFRACPGCRLRIQRLSLWLYRKTTIYDRRSDLSEVHFTVCVEHAPPLQSWPRDSTERPGGFFPDLFYEMQELMNFSMTVIRSIDGKWGGKTGNGSWNGMVGMVMRGEADMSMSEFSVLDSRRQVVDYSMAMLADAIRFTMLRPDLANDWFMFLNTLHWHFIIVILTMVAVFSVGFLAVVKFSRETGYEKRDSASLSLQSLLNQGFIGAQFNTLPGKLMFLAAWIIGLGTLTAFGARLTAVFAVQEFKLPINSLEDLINKPSYKFSVQLGSSYQSFFSLAPEGTLRKRIYDHLMVTRPENYVLNNIEGFAKAESDPSVVYLSKDSAYYNSKYTCTLAISPYVVYSVSKGFIFQKGLIYKEFFDYHLHRLVELGSLVRLKERYLIKKTDADCFTGDPRGLGFSKMCSVFALGAFGVACALAVFSAEAMHTSSSRIAKYIY